LDFFKFLIILNLELNDTVGQKVKESISLPSQGLPDENVLFRLNEG